MEFFFSNIVISHGVKENHMGMVTIGATNIRIGASVKHNLTNEINQIIRTEYSFANDKTLILG